MNSVDFTLATQLAQEMSFAADVLADPARRYAYHKTGYCGPSAEVTLSSNERIDVRKIKDGTYTWGAVKKPVTIPVIVVESGDEGER